MAKSLRAKKPTRARAVRRATINGPAEYARALRLAKRLGTLKEDSEMQVDESESTEDKPKKKISTSGWKGSRNDSYKKKRAKKNRTLKF